MKLLLLFLLFSTGAFSQVSQCLHTDVYISALNRYPPPLDADTVWLRHSPIQNGYAFAPDKKEKAYGMYIFSNQSDTVCSIHEGTVVVESNFKRFGKILIVLSDSFHITYYVGEEQFVKKGDSIKTGQKIGRSIRLTSGNPYYRTAIAVTHTKKEYAYTFDEVRSVLNGRLRRTEHDQ